MAQLKLWLYQIVVSVAWFHDWLVRYNRQHSHLFNNSELHFIVIGIFGLLLFLLVYLLYLLNLLYLLYLVYLLYLLYLLYLVKLVNNE